MGNEPGNSSKTDPWVNSGHIHKSQFLLVPHWHQHIAKCPKNAAHLCATGFKVKFLELGGETSMCPMRLMGHNTTVFFQPQRKCGPPPYPQTGFQLTPDRQANRIFSKLNIQAHVKMGLLPRGIVTKGSFSPSFTQN